MQIHVHVFEGILLNMLESKNLQLTINNEFLQRDRSSQEISITYSETDFQEETVQG